MKRGHKTKEIWFQCSCFRTPIGPSGLQQEHIMAVVTVSTAAARNGATHTRNHEQRKYRSDSPYQQRTTQRDNPTQMLIKQAVDHLIRQLEAGKSETLTAYLAAMARFHNYSFGNILAIARQRPTATKVAGFNTWKEM